MPIDWFTVIAQILNFVVLIWILKRFLYQPVLKTMSERQESVRRSISEAREERERANLERAQLAEERRQLAEGREAALQGIEAEAKAERKRLIDEARQEFEHARSRWREALSRERAEFQQELSAEARREVIAISERLLRELADSDLQGMVVHKFLGMLSQLDAGGRDRLRSSLSEATSPVAVVRSAFPLPQDLQDSVTRAARELLGAGVAVEFETRPALGCGIELGVDGQKVAWNIDDYFHSLDACMHELVASHSTHHDGGN